MGQSQLDARSACKHCQTSDHRLVVMVMLLMMLMLTIRTGRCATHSTAWFPRVSATGLEKRHTPPKVACELAYFLWQWHRLIEIGQELAKHSSSCHLSCSPHHFLLHCITLLCPIDCPGHIAYHGAFTSSPARARHTNNHVRSLAVAPIMKPADVR